MQYNDDSNIQQAKELIEVYNGWPKEGVDFLDISPVLARPFIAMSIGRKLAEHCLGSSKIVALDARGFLFGSLALPYAGIPLVMARKAGKLPGQVYSKGYALEYGEERIEVQQHALSIDDRVVIIDDVLATGGTAAAVQQIVECSGASLEKVVTVLEIEGLNGRAKLPGVEVHSLIKV